MLGGVQLALATIITLLSGAESLSRARLCATPWTAAHQAPLPLGFFRQEHWSGLPCPPPGDLPGPGTEPAPPVTPTLAGSFFTTGAT